MPKIKPITEDDMKAAYAILADAIRSYEPDRLDENTVNSLRFMLKHDNFAPVRDVIMDKLIDIGEYFRNKEERIVKTNLEGKPINKPKNSPKRDNRKKKKKQANAANAPEGSTLGLTMNFIQTKEGILVPLKK